MTTNNDSCFALRGPTSSKPTMSAQLKAKRAGGASDLPGENGVGDRAKRTRVSDYGGDTHGNASAMTIESRIKSEAVVSVLIASASREPDWSEVRSSAAIGSLPRAAASSPSTICVPSESLTRPPARLFGSTSASFPRVIKEIFRVWCRGDPAASHVAMDVSVNKEMRRDELRREAEFDSNDRYSDELVWFEKNPRPILKFSFGSLTYDKAYRCLMGEVLEEVAVNNARPRGLGTRDAYICTADDSGTKLFVCGGLQYCDSNEEWVESDAFRNEEWVESDAFSREYSTAAAMLDIETGLWEELPEMPEVAEHGYSGLCCRMDTKIYIFRGSESTSSHRKVFCFDLIKKEWIDSKCQFLPHAELSFTRFVEKLDETTNLVISYTSPFPRGKMALTLDVTSGTWAYLGHLPRSLSHLFDYRGLTVKSDTHDEGSFILISGEKWARLLPSGAWELMPDLGEFSEKIASLHFYSLHGPARPAIFTGNGNGRHFLRPGYEKIFFLMFPERT